MKIAFRDINNRVNRVIRIEIEPEELISAVKQKVHKLVDAQVDEIIFYNCNYEKLIDANKMKFYLDEEISIKSLSSYSIYYSINKEKVKINIMLG